MFKNLVTPNVSEDDRIFATNLQRRLRRLIKSHQELSHQLRDESKNKKSKVEDLKLLQSLLHQNTTELNGVQLALQTSVISLYDYTPESL